MKFTKTPLDGVVIIEPNIFKDSRGYFFESYSENEFQKNGITAQFVQDNQSKSSYGVVRGLHCQLGEHSQAKLVRVLQGKVLDVAVDVRPDSPTFGKHVAVELSAENQRQLFIPKNFLHGFSVLSDTAIFAYKVDSPYCKESEFGIRYDDPEIGVDWKVPKDKIITSEKDRMAHSLQELKKPQKILITGARGQLGTELSKLLPDAILTDVDELDITDADAVQNFVKANNIGTIINCAAYTNVDKAESNLVLASKINAIGPSNLAKTGCKIVHISTDYVFDGSGHTPYRPEDPVNPISIYGKTKRAGEKAVLENASNAVVIRTAWLYSPHGNNFVKTMRKLGAEKESINVVSDQIGTPTYAADLAQAIVQILPQMTPKTKGIYHYTNEGVCSWYDFATQIMADSRLKCHVNPISSSDYPTEAIRPFYSVLDKSKIKETFGVSTSHWTNGLKRCIEQINKENTHKGGTNGTMHHSSFTRT